MNNQPVFYIDQIRHFFWANTEVTSIPIKSLFIPLIRIYYHKDY